MILVSGGTPFGSAIDFASGYICHILGFIGITEVTFITGDKRFKDDQALKLADEAVDPLIRQL